MQVAGRVRVVPGPVVLFGDILAQIVEFQPVVLEELDELVVPRANRTRWRAALISVVRIMPEAAAVRTRPTGGL